MEMSIWGFHSAVEMSYNSFLHLSPILRGIYSYHFMKLMLTVLFTVLSGFPCFLLVWTYFLGYTYATT
jgi:hypothetical protein